MNGSPSWLDWIDSPLILKNFLDRNHLPWITELCLVHNSKASITDDLQGICCHTDFSAGSWSLPWCRCRTPPWTCPAPGPGSLSPSSPCSRPCWISSSRRNYSRYCLFVNLRRMWCEAYWSSWSENISHELSCATTTLFMIISKTLRWTKTLNNLYLVSSLKMNMLE